MPAFLTQRNAVYIGGSAAGWAALQGMGLTQKLMSDNVSHWIEAILVFLIAFFSYAGFKLTPNGNSIPNELISSVDRKVAITRAGDAVVDALTTQVIKDAANSELDKLDKPDKLDKLDKTGNT